MWTENVAKWYQGHNKSALQAILLDRVDELGERASQKIKCRHLHIVCNCWVKDWKVWVQTLGGAYFVQYQILPCQHIERTTLYFISGTVHWLKCTGVHCSVFLFSAWQSCSMFNTWQRAVVAARGSISPVREQHTGILAAAAAAIPLQYHCTFCLQYRMMQLHTIIYNTAPACHAMQYPAHWDYSAASPCSATPLILHYEIPAIPVL